MAQVFGGNNATVPPPVMSGGYHTGTGMSIIDGRGLIAPWGGGPLARQYYLPVGIGEVPTEQNQLQSMLTAMAQQGPGGDTINYNFQGLIGPPGNPGPPGATQLVFAQDTDGSLLNAPTRVLDDGAVPATVANVVCTAMLEAVMVEWDSNTELDIDHYKIYRHTSDASGSSSLIAISYATLMVDGNRTPGTTYWYWVKACDYLGNVSASYSTSASATASDVDDSVTVIAASKVLIDGATYLSNWRKTGDLTKIDGGDISANTITLTSSASDFDLANITGDADDVSEGAANKYISGAQTTKLAGIATGADVTGSNTANDTSNVNGLAASSVSGWSHASNTTKIDGGDIYTNTIVADSITANTITYNELRQTAGTEAVDTGAIRDDATTIFDSDSTSGAISCTGSTWTTVGTVSNFPSEGGAITVVGSAYANSAIYAMKVGLYEGGSLIAESGYTTSSGGKQFNASATRVPGSGNITYYVKCFTGGTHNASNRNLVVSEQTGK